MKASFIWSLYETFSYPRSFHLNPDHGGVAGLFLSGGGDFVPFFENLTTAAIALLVLYARREVVA